MPSVRFLEIGYGDTPACLQGEVFAQNNIDYIGVELIGAPSNERVPVSWRNGANQYTFPEVGADMMSLPFQDKTFDVVLMRSVFGQVIEGLDRGTLHVLYGVLEVRRVLKELGLLIICEENTPTGMSYIRSQLIGAVFDIDFQHQSPGLPWEQTPDNNPWKAERRHYLTDEPRGAYSRYSHITCGRKVPNVPTSTEAIDVYDFLGSIVSRQFDIPQPSEEWNKAMVAKHFS